VLFVISDLSGGGAERVLIHVLNGLSRDRWRPSLALLQGTNDYPLNLAADVPVTCLGKRGTLSIFRLVGQLAALYRRTQPHLIVSFLTYTNYLTLIARQLSGCRIPVIVSERNTPSRALASWRFACIHKSLVRATYSRADTIIAISRGVREDLERCFRVPARLCQVLYNPVAVDEVRTAAKEPADHSWFSDQIPIVLACGRLVPQKNYPLLLNAMKRVLEHRPARLFVLGKGPQLASLQALAGKLGIASSVHFAGFQSNPFKFMARAKVFALSSLWEGFGNVLVEAMACGIPVVATRCPSGPEEIVTDGVNGLLVPSGDPDALAAAILRLLEDEAVRRRLSEAALKRAEDFRAERMISGYERVFAEVLNRAQGAR
jgi:glycosyltransferase involved in cell wall biosynthesis